MLDISIFSKQWDVAFATEIVFGVGCLKQLGKVCTAYGNSALLVTGRSAVRTGVVDRCLELLGQSHIRVERYHSITPDPTVYQVDDIVTLAHEKKCEMLVAVGGGSAIDATKAAAVVIAQGARAQDYLTGEKSVKTGGHPVIAVPTTAGTGAELSKGAILSCPAKELKSSIRGTAVCPRVAIVDPSLTLTLPLEQVRITGFDILTHAVETYISRQANPITAMFSCNAVKAVTSYLPQALQNPRDMTARTHLSFYSMLMGYNLANSTTCLPHRMQYPLGATTHTAHALGLAALYASWIQTTSDASTEKFEEVASWIAEGLGLPKNDPSPGILPLLQRFMQTIGLTPTLRDLGIDEPTCLRLASMVTGKLESDPWWREGADLSAIYRSALDPIPRFGGGS